MAMLSSLPLSVQLTISTWSEHSGSHPSVFFTVAAVVTASTVTLRHSVGWICQNWALCSVTPWIRTVSQLYGSMNVDRNWWPEPGTTRLRGSVTPFAISDSR
jgi:hypothetical protein